MGSSTAFKGTIIANNAAIDMTTNDTLEGRALSTAGAINLNQVLAYTPTGCGSNVHPGPLAPNLGTAACYAILSGNGSVTNSGITHVTGDVGTNVGLTTGYNPLNVTGTVHPIPDVSTALAAADLLIAYNYLNVLPYDIELLYPAQFGNKLVLTPHTYLLNAATAFNGTVYLNAEGNSNAVFVIKINGALTTSTFSKVILINGAKAANVYWKVDGAVNINDYSVFNGTIICNNGAVNLTTGDSLNGRAFTTSGALSTAAIVANSPSGACLVLPVSWLYFRAQALQTTAVLQWGTAAELNNAFFTVQKSRDGILFENIATINASATPNEASNYSFTDRLPYSSGYYRIAQTDRGGQVSYSALVQVQMNTSKPFKAVQYAKDNHVYVEISGTEAGKGSIELYSMEGKKIVSQKIQLSKETARYKITQAVPAGIYMLNIVSNGQRLHSARLMVL